MPGGRGGHVCRRQRRGGRDWVRGWWAVRKRRHSCLVRAEQRAESPPQLSPLSTSVRAMESTSKSHRSEEVTRSPWNLPSSGGVGGGLCERSGLPGIAQNAGGPEAPRGIPGSWLCFS